MKCKQFHHLLTCLFSLCAEGYREGYPYDVTVSRLENEGFGFVIISSVSRAGSTIGRIIPGKNKTAFVTYCLSRVKDACEGRNRLKILSSLLSFSQLPSQTLYLIKSDKFFLRHTDRYSIITLWHGFSRCFLFCTERMFAVPFLLYAKATVRAPLSANKRIFNSSKDCHLPPIKIERNYVTLYF